MKKMKICLNMIVKNEKKIIKRCFESVKNHIDYWVISDTGSTDGTQDFIRDFFKKEKIPGELLEHKWVDFSHNRNLALQSASGKADYIFFMDADDYLEIGEKGFQDLESDAYLVNMEANSVLYSNIKLVKSGLPWEWKGVLHEVLNCHVDFSVLKYHDDSCIIQSTREGARSNNPDKYKKDADILEAALLEEPDNSRYQFYLARSYYDYHDFGRALVAYEKRSSMGGWEEEVYYSLLGVAYCKENLGINKLAVMNCYLKAYKYRPRRLEGLYEAIKICRIGGFYNLGYELGRFVKKTEQPNDLLFVDIPAHQWKLLDEYSICAIESGELNIARKIISKLLKLNGIPPEERNRLESNLQVAITHLKQDKN